MKKTFYFVSILFISMVLFSTSCNNKVKSNTTQSSKPKVDTLWNDRVQDTFFGATLGDDISVVKENFVKHELYLLKDVSTDELLHYLPTGRRFFSFGGEIWTNIDVFVDNGRFRGVRLMNVSNDKASALDLYNNLKDTVGKKYKLTQSELPDSTFYAKNVIYGKNDALAVIYCKRFETMKFNIRIGVFLEYITLKDLGGISDEL